MRSVRATPIGPPRRQQNDVFGPGVQTSRVANRPRRRNSGLRPGALRRSWAGLASDDLLRQGLRPLFRQPNDCDAAHHGAIPVRGRMDNLLRKLTASFARRISDSAADRCRERARIIGRDPRVRRLVGSACAHHPAKCRVFVAHRVITLRAQIGLSEVRHASTLRRAIALADEHDVAQVKNSRGLQTH